MKLTFTLRLSPLAALTCCLAPFFCSSSVYAQGDFQPVRRANPPAAQGPTVQGQAPFPGLPTQGLPTTGYSSGSDPDRALNHMSPPYWGSESPSNQAFPTPYGTGYQLPASGTSGPRFMPGTNPPAGANTPAATNPGNGQVNQNGAFGERGQTFQPTLTGPNSVIEGNDATPGRRPGQPGSSSFQPASSSKSVLNRGSQVWESTVDTPPSAQKTRTDDAADQPAISPPQSNSEPATAPHWTVPYGAMPSAPLANTSPTAVPQAATPYSSVPTQPGTAPTQPEWNALHPQGYGAQRWPDSGPRQFDSGTRQFDSGTQWPSENSFPDQGRSTWPNPSNPAAPYSSQLGHNAGPEYQEAHPLHWSPRYSPQEPQPTVPFASEPSLYEKGFRSLEPTYRPQTWDSGERFDFENKKGDYPPLSEILATGRYFVMAEWQYLRPYATPLGGLTIDSGIVNRTRTLDYQFESAPRFRAGFESKYGPGVEFEYFQFDHDSRPLIGTSTVTDTLRTHVELPAQAGSVSLLQSTGANQQLLVRHDLELHTLGMSFFKEFKLPKARMNGTFGWRYVSIAQTQFARLTAASGAELGRLIHTTDYRGLGPRFGFEYYRPIGHTRIEFIGTFNASLLYGNRDQIVFNTQQGYDERLGANELTTNLDIFGGAQYVHPVGENRAVYARLGLVSQSWLGGGNGTQADGDFGLRGISFAVGWNR